MRECQYRGMLRGYIYIYNVNPKWTKKLLSNFLYNQSSKNYIENECKNSLYPNNYVAFHVVYFTKKIRQIIPFYLIIKFIIDMLP